MPNPCGQFNAEMADGLTLANGSSTQSLECPRFPLVDFPIRAPAIESKSLVVLPYFVIPQLVYSRFMAGL